MRNMSIHLPDFRQDFLYSISVCTLLHVDDASVLGELPFAAYAEYRIADDAEAIFAVDIEREERDDAGKHFHLHINVCKKDSASLHGSPTQLDIDSLKAIFNPLQGQLLAAYIDGNFSIPRSDLPRHGMIATLLGLSTRSCGSEMEVRGATFAMYGDTFTDLNWKHNEKEDCVYGYLAGDIDIPLDDDLLTNINSLLHDGIYCFVLERNESDVHQHVDSTRPKKVDG